MGSWPTASTIRRGTTGGLLVLVALALLSIAYGARTAWRDSADLDRRSEEAGLFCAGADPYDDEFRDNTYPPSALPVFAVLVPSLPDFWLRTLWLGMNLAALAVVAGVLVSVWGRGWPVAVQVAFVLAVFASKPARAGIALGQFHLLPLALMIVAEASLGRSHQGLSGLLAGLSLVKPTMSAPYAASLLTRRRWIAFATGCALQAALWLGASAWLGIGPARLGVDWLRNARSQVSAGTIDLPSLASSAVEPAATSAAIMLASTVVLFALRKRSSLGQLSLALYFGAVGAYHRHYDMVLLLPSLAYLIESSRTRGRIWIAVLAVVLGLTLIAPSHPSVMPLPEEVHDRAFLVVSYATLAAMIVLVATEMTPTTPAPPEGGNRGRGRLGTGD